MLEQSPFPQCIITRDYKLIAVNKAYRDRYQSTGSLVGTTCHQASHKSDLPCAENGESCPLLQCMRSRGPAAVEHIHEENQGRRKVRIEMVPLLDVRGRSIGFIETIRPQVDHEEKGIVMFDIRGFLHQGMDPANPDIAEINKRQQRVLATLHDELEAERAFRLGAQCSVPLVEHFVCTGDGYYLIGRPNLNDILDIAHCMRGVLDAHHIPAYQVAHVGSVHSFVDMTGKTNVTGYAMGVAARIQSVAKVADNLICTQEMISRWKPNPFYDQLPLTGSATAKDGVTYHWTLARRKGPEEANQP